MKFKIFVGWQVRVCSNLMLTCDGNSGTIECLTEADIMQKAFELFKSFDPNKENTLRLLENLQNTTLSIDKIIVHIGYENSSYFYRVFREKYGCSPSEYRLHPSL